MNEIETTAIDLLNEYKTYGVQPQVVEYVMKITSDPTCSEMLPSGTHPNSREGRDFYRSLGNRDAAIAIDTALANLAVAVALNRRQEETHTKIGEMILVFTKGIAAYSYHQAVYSA